MRRVSTTTTAALLLLATALPAAAGSFATEVESFAPGPGAGFGQDRFPGIVFGPPRGGSITEGSLDVLSLGSGGEIVFRFAADICDGPGPDFTIFENAFAAGDPTGAIFAEVGIVAVSADGANFVSFAYDTVTFAGLAGRSPVLSHPDNGVDPFDPSVSGGDSFDLADLGVARARFVRIRDGGASIPDPGNRVPPGDSGGFDLDAAALLHACDAVTGTPTPTATATATATEAIAAEATPTPTVSTAATPTPTVVRGDADGDGRIDATDVDYVWREHFDGDGDAAAAVGGGTVRSTPMVDANGDGKVTAADLVAAVVQVAGSGT
jgi:hypothetical protein